MVLEGPYIPQAMTTTWRKPEVHIAYLLLPSIALDISTIRNGQPTLQSGFYKAVQTRI